MKLEKSLILALTLALLSTTAYSAEKTTEEAIAHAKENIPTEDEVNDLLDKAGLEAGSITYDKNTGEIIAEDDVIFSYKKTQLKAERIEYNQTSHIVKSSSGIEYKDPEGTVFKASEINITDTFDKGEMSNVTAQMADGSTFKTDNLTVINADKYRMNDSEYSPCKPCENGKYMWSFQADKIIYNEGDGKVTYRNAYLKLFGQKIFYTPWISHPTPSAKSKSGFLTPKFGQSSDFGVYAQIPYYYQPKTNLDFTFSPLLTSKDGPILIGQMRHLVERGYYEVEASGANPRETDVNGNPIAGGGNKFRGHVKAKGDFEFAENWGWGFDAARSTDDTYLRRYKLGNYEDVLTSEAYVNRLADRNYFSTKVVTFQDLRAGVNPATVPFVAPLIRAGRTFELSDKYDQKIITDINTMMLKRDQGADSSRVIGSAAWSADYLTNGGQLVNVKVSNRLDQYNVDDVSFQGSQYSGSVNRYIPTASVTMSYPLQKGGERYGVVLEPVTMVVVSSNGNNNLKIPNEDSQNFELYDDNLFEESHASGYDIVEDGTRVNYGVRGILTSQDIGDYNFLLGQTYRTNIDSATFSPATGLSEHISDYVGRIVTSGQKFSSSYRFRLDKDNFSFRRNEVGVGIDLSPITLASSYTFTNADPAVSERQELYTAGRVSLTDEWGVIANARRNMDNDNDAGWVGVGGGLDYSNDCFATSVELNREFVRDRDIEPSTEIRFKFTLKNFGN